MSIESKKAVAYCRAKQGEPYEETVEHQKTIISQYAEAYGYTITDWYCDKVWFDRPTVRPEYRQMMKDVVNGKVHGVITAQIDRFSDNVCDFADSAKIMAARSRRSGRTLTMQGSPSARTPRRRATHAAYASALVTRSVHID